MENIVIVGYGGHGKSVADTIERTGKYRIVGYTDVKKNQETDYMYLGTDDVLEAQFHAGVSCAIIGLGYMGNGQVRNKLYDKLKKIGYSLPAVIDPSAVISENAQVAEGTFVGKNAIINAYACVGRNCIINTGAIVEHECLVGDESHIAVGASMCGQSKVGKFCFIGANATIIQCISIGENTIIGAGSTVIKDMPSKVVAVGNPAKVIKNV